VLPTEFLKKIQEIEIRTKNLVNTLFAGDYKSSFKGRGIEFLDVREYLPGDDVRTIDWKVTARFGKPYVKKYAEERELIVILVVDASGSERFGTRQQLKLEQAASIAATLAFSAVRNNDKVGLLFFTDKVEKFIPPRKGRFHVLRLVRDILYFSPEGKATDPVLALEFLMHILKRRAIVFFISDFVGDCFKTDQIRISLGVAAKRHDLVVLTINDPSEDDLPNIGLVELEDAETGEILTSDTRDKNLRDRYHLYRQQKYEERERLFKMMGIDHIDVKTSEDFSNKLHKFFQVRARRYR
jgi:uncharacterized protein (DUF58 family)